MSCVPSVGIFLTNFNSVGIFLAKFSIKLYTCRNHVSYTSIKFLPACTLPRNSDFLFSLEYVTISYTLSGIMSEVTAELNNY